MFPPRPGQCPAQGAFRSARCNQLYAAFNTDAVYRIPGATIYNFYEYIARLDVDFAGNAPATPSATPFLAAFLTVKHYATWSEADVRVLY